MAKFECRLWRWTPNVYFSLNSLEKGIKNVFVCKGRPLSCQDNAKHSADLKETVRMCLDLAKKCDW